jgi:ABC-type polysaccharide/polyol phosphate export permease
MPAMSQPVYTDAQQRSIARLPRDLIRARELLLDLVWKDIRVRYRAAAMGLLWAVIEPLAMTLILTFVFSLLVGLKAGAETGIFEGYGAPVALIILAGYVPWQFFSQGVSGATRSLVDNKELVKKVNFPREVIPMAAVGQGVVNFAIGFVMLLLLFGAAALYFGLDGFGAALVWVPVVFAIQTALILGLGLLLACGNAFFRDVSYITDVALVFGFYASPVFYSPPFVQDFFATGWGGRFAWVYTLWCANPMVGIITGYREAILNNAAPPAGLLGWSALVAAVAFAAGLLVFRRRSPVLSDAL